MHADESDLANLIHQWADAHGGTCHQHEYGKSLAVCVEGRVPLAMIETLVTGDGAKTKHLTTLCWQQSNAFLDSLLDGYLWGDAHHDVPNQRWRLGFTRNYYLAADLRTLAARLGYQIQLRLDFATLGDRRYETYRGELRKTVSGHHNCWENTEVVRIGRSNGRAFWDIGVEDEPHLFALASGVLTHNSKPNPMPEPVTDRPTKAHDYLFLLAKSERYYYDANAIAETTAETSGWSRQRMRGINTWEYNNTAARIAATGQRAESSTFGTFGKRNKRSVWTVNTQSYKGEHYATFPEALVEPCILAGAPLGGLVFDPFIGSGTVGAVAERLGRRWIGTDLSYQDLAAERTMQLGFRW